MFRITPSTRSRALVAALACVVTALSWPSGAAPAAAAAADGELSGRVQNSYGVPVAGAEVALTDAASGTPVARTVTDAKGVYTASVPKGTYDATVSGAAVAGTASVGRLRGITVAANSKLTIALMPPADAQATFSGVLRDSDGAPLPGVTLNMSTHGVYKTALTSTDGSFSLAGPVGRYSLSLNRWSYTTVGDTTVSGSWGAYVSSFELGGDVARDITIPTKDVTVSLRTESGAPLPGASVNGGSFATNETFELFPGGQANAMWNVQGTTDSAGKLKWVGLPTSALGMSVSPADPGMSRVYKTVSLTKDTTYNFVSHPNVTFSGVVRNSDGSPLAGAGVSLANAETNSSVSADADGRFTLRAPKGSYTLNLSSYPGTSVPPYDVVQVSVPLELTGDRTQDLTVPATNLRAHVTDPSGAAVAGATASVALPSDPASWSAVTLFPGGTGTGYRQSFRTTDASGNALLRVLPGSTVSVSARPADRTAASSNLREMTVEWGAACPGGDRDWSHPVSGQCVAELALRPLVSVRGVVDPAAPRTGNRVFAYRNSNGHWESYEATAGADGSYDLRVPAGRFDNLSIGANGCCVTPGDAERPASWNVEAGPFEVTGPTTLNLTPPFLHGTIRAYDAGGQALRLGGTYSCSDTGSAPVKGSLAAGLPIKSGHACGSGAPAGDGAARIAVLHSMPFRISQYYDPGFGQSGAFPTLNASGLSLTANGDVALVITAAASGTTPTPSTTSTTGSSGSSTTTSTSTTTTTRPSAPGTTGTTGTTATTATTSTTAPVDGEAGKASAPGRSGYWMTTAEGEVHAFGDAKHHGQPRGALGAARAVDLEPTRTGLGYWVLDSRGRIHPFGDARHLGDADPARLVSGEKAASLSATPSGGGYWIFTDKGRVLTFGDAGFHGDVAHIKLNGPVLGSVATPSGRGYWMVASDGGIFSFGDAKFHGSTGKLRLNRPVMGMAPAPGGGYWLVASDGGIFAFDVPFFGSMGAIKLNKPISGMVPGRNGYLMVAEDGGIFSFGDVAFHGSLGAKPPASPVVSVALLP